MARLDIFISNSEFIANHNARADANQETYRLAPNQFTHLTSDEFKHYMNLHSTKTSQIDGGRNLRGAGATANSSAPIPPLRVDWVKAGGVTAVKDQGKCGSGWAFSTVGALEGAYFRKYGKLLSFSTQQVVSCDASGAGCNGGFDMKNGFTFVSNNHGLALEEQYPYTSGLSGESGSCQTAVSNVAEVAPLSYSTVMYGNTYALMQAVAAEPVSIAVDAGNQAFQFYSSGVLSTGCTWTLNHGVLLVGYDNDESSGLDYWKVKNSWGSSWGESGYIRIKKSTEDLCGVLDDGSYPNLGMN